MVKRNPRTKKAVRLEAETLKEGNLTTPIIKDEGIARISVDLYLKSRKVPLWERGGKRAYAIKKGKEYLTEEQFDELFKKY